MKKKKEERRRCTQTKVKQETQKQKMNNKI